MKFEDLNSTVEMTSVRGGSNSIRQSSKNGPATGVVGVHGSKFNLSPVSVTSSVLQQNATTQMAAIEDVYTRDTKISIDASQLDFGFGWRF